MHFFNVKINMKKKKQSGFKPNFQRTQLRRKLLPLKGFDPKINIYPQKFIRIITNVDILLSSYFIYVVYHENYCI